MAKEENLIEIKHIAIDGTKIKAKTSLNKLTDEKQLKLLKKILKESITLDELEDQIIEGEEDNLSVDSLNENKYIDKLFEKIKEKDEDNKNKDKLNATGYKLLKRGLKDKKSKEKVLNKINKCEEELQKTKQKVVSVNDPESRLMKNKKGNWEYDYNLQISADAKNGILLSVSLNNHPTDHYELIPQN